MGRVDFALAVRNRPLHSSPVLVEYGLRSLRMSLAADGHGDFIVAVANVLQDLHGWTEEEKAAGWSVGRIPPLENTLIEPNL